MQAPSLTIGIEEEYQLIDPATGELKPAIEELLGDKKAEAGGELKPELHRSQVEIGTGVCKTPVELRAELVKLRRHAVDIAGRHGLAIVAAGTHPFSAWEAQEITPSERYLGIQHDMQDVARQSLVFGTHVHVAVEDKDFLIDCMNVARYFLPHVLCLSTSSPFWSGRDTGLKSYRSIVFQNFPRTGLPPRFASWSEYEGMVSTMTLTRCVPDGTKIWYDVRPNWKYPTLEFRICDVCTRVDEAVCIAAIFQAVIAKLWKLRRDNLTFRSYPTELIAENKWRAVRYGLDGQLIDFGKQQEKPARELIRELIDWFLRDVIDELGSRKEVEYAYTILDNGSSADRQLRCHKASGGDLRPVVARLAAETREGL